MSILEFQMSADKLFAVNKSAFDQQILCFTQLFAFNNDQFLVDRIECSSVSLRQTNGPFERIYYGASEGTPAGSELVPGKLVQAAVNLTVFTEQMDAVQVLCPNQHCKARGHFGQENIVIHGKKRPRYRCKACGKTASRAHGYDV